RRSLLRGSRPCSRAATTSRLCPDSSRQRSKVSPQETRRPAESRPPKPQSYSFATSLQPGAQSKPARSIGTPPLPGIARAWGRESPKVGESASSGRQGFQRLPAGRDSQLPQQALHVGAHGVLGDIEPLRDLIRGEMLVEEQEHLATDEIAKRLYISEHTVRSHVKSLLRKLGVSSRREALEALSTARGCLPHFACPPSPGPGDARPRGS